MALSSGEKLAHYEIVDAIGKGGMGEVYRARDTKLERDVAIKVIPEELARDRERLARFKREAKLLASLNHPNIAAIHGLEEHGGTPFLVMELVDGETLGERIARGPVALDESFPLFVQIAEGLASAHDHGIVHRDLKPANVKIASDGRVKILDFGLAKAFAEDETADASSSLSPTLTRGTAIGTILGTAAYMSPEQAKGKAVDRRADVWAFGCCLYEALTGRRAFDKDDVSETLASVLRTSPIGRAFRPCRAACVASSNNACAKTRGAGCSMSATHASHSKTRRKQPKPPPSGARASPPSSSPPSPQRSWPLSSLLLSHSRSRPTFEGSRLCFPKGSGSPSIPDSRGRRSLFLLTAARWLTSARRAEPGGST